MSGEIGGQRTSLRWLADLMAFFQQDTIKVPSEYRERVIQTKELLSNDSSGIVSTVLDFAINCASVDFYIETDNENLTDVLNRWLATLNFSLLGSVPTGIVSLAKEYFRERWKGSSNLLMRTFWEYDKESGLRLPKTAFFVDGEDIKCKNKSKNSKAVILGDEQYFLRVSPQEKDDIPLPKDPKTEKIFVQKPFEAWGVREPVPFLIRRGLFRNIKFLELVSGKGEFVIARALEYLLLLKKGTERMALDGDVSYSEADLKKASDDFKKLVMERKSVDGTPSYTTNFDTQLEHVIPEYSRIINGDLYNPIEKRLLAGLGLIEIVEGTASNRRESLLNPKPFIGEVRQGITDFRKLLEDISLTIVLENQASHKKWMGAAITVHSTPIPQFMDDKIKTLMRGIYDRGGLSKRTLVETIGELDYDIEVKHRKDEKKSGEDELMFAPVIQNTGKNGGASQKVLPEGEPLPDRIGPEKKNFNQSAEDIESAASTEETVYDEAPYKTVKDLPSQVKVLPSRAQSIWMRVFNDAYPKGEDYARKVAWSVVKKLYRKSGDSWIRKTKGEIEESFRDMDMSEIVELRKLEIMGKQNTILDALLKDMSSQS